MSTSVSVSQNEWRERDVRRFKRLATDPQTRLVLLQQLDRQIPQLVEQSFVGTSPTPAEPADRVPIDDHIDAIFAVGHAGRPLSAVSEFDQLESEYAKELDDRLRYRICANRGHAWLEAEEPLKAAEQYERAATFKPFDDREGFWLRCLAAELASRGEEAVTRSDALVIAHPTFDRGWAVWVRSRPAKSSPRSACRRIPRNLRRDADVAAALSTLHRRARSWRGAIAYARVALRGVPGRVPAMALLGTVLLEYALQSTSFKAPHGLRVENESPVREAIGLLSQAIDVFKDKELNNMLAVCLANRGAARRLIGEFEAADEDVREAYRVFPTSAVAIARYVSLLDRKNEYADVIRVIDAAGSAGDDAASQFFLALALQRRGQPGDYDRAKNVLRRLIGRGVDALGNSFSDVVGLLCNLLLAEGNRADAIKVLEELPAGAISEPLRVARLAELRASAAVTKEKVEHEVDTPTDLGPQSESAVDSQPTTGALEPSAVELVRQAATDAIEAGDALSCLEIGHIALRLGDARTAADLLSELVEPVRWDQTTHVLLEALFKAGRDLALVNACQALRTAGVLNRNVAWYEARALVRNGEPTRAMDVIATWLAQHPDDREAHLQHGLIAVHAGRLAEACFDIDLLPRVTDFRSAEAGAAMPEYLRTGGKAREALRFAYELHRRFPAAEAARHALITSVWMLPRSDPPIDVSVLRERPVDGSTAVTFRTISDGSIFDMFIEELPIADDEHPPTHPLIRAAWGMRAGSHIDVDGREYEIAAVNDKMIKRAADRLADYERRFPNSDQMVRYEVPDAPADPTDPRSVLGKVWDVLAADDKRRRQSLELYMSQQVPLSTIAKLLERPVVRMMAHVASTASGGRIIANAGHDDAVAARLMKRMGQLVLDETAIGTVYLLGLDERLSELPFKLIVPESALAPLARMARDFAGNSGGQIAVHDGKFFLDDLSDDRRGAMIGRLTRLVDNLKRHCEVEGGLARQKLPDADREGLLRVTTEGTLDAIAIARERGVPLWTDDEALVPLCLRGLSITRVWTQRVLMSKGVDRALYRRCVLDLVRARYEFVRLSIDDVISAMSDAEWRSSARALQPLFNYLGRHSIANPDNALLTRLLIRKIWVLCPKRSRRALILKLIGSIPRKAAARLIARPLYHPNHKLTKDQRDAFGGLRRVLRAWRQCG